MNQRPPSVWVVSIHDKEKGFLTFDVSDILAALRPTVDALLWIVNIWEFEGGDDVLPDGGVEGGVMTTADLSDLYKIITQTITGEFVAIRPALLDAEYHSGRPNLRQFCNRNLEIGILALECDFFVVWTKDEKHVEALKRRFLDVRYEPLGRWCDEPD